MEFHALCIPKLIAKADSAPPASTWHTDVIASSDLDRINQFSQLAGRVAEMCYNLGNMRGETGSQ
jgi:hypothetical protein